MTCSIKFGYLYIVEDCKFCLEKIGAFKARVLPRKVNAYIYMCVWVLLLVNRENLVLC